MEEILQLSKSPTFWFSSVVIAFLMSLFASYVKDWIENLKLKISAKRKSKKEKDNQYFIEKAKELSNRPELVSVYLSDIIFHKIRNVLYLLVGYIMMGFAANNALNDKMTSALIFAAIALLVLTIPMQVTASKVRKMSDLVNEVVKDDVEHFRD